ncbi:MAG TPA: chloride channel protein [Alphaproteobacteria bacterium]|nr:chloride channel protein [Alphaproteobacteria bacterium]
MIDFGTLIPRLVPSGNSIKEAHQAARVRWRALMWDLERRKLRNNQIALIGLAAAMGIAIGAGVVVLHVMMQWLHETVFRMPSGQLLSEGIGLDWRYVIAVPIVGGLVVGLVTVLIRTWRPREMVDAIEANALYGGRLSLVDSINLAILTLLSGGFGASVGMEAAYTQIGAGLASTAGRVLRVRRSDLRTLVGCGAAAAIAAAFNAPLAGAFYAFELVIGMYSPAVLAPVTVAALGGAFTSRWLLGSEPIFLTATSVQIGGWDYALFGLLGIAAAGLGIAIMIAVTWIERGFRAWSVPIWLRPAIGGVVLGGTAFFFPQVLGSGHGAMEAVLGLGFSPFALLALIPAKAMASAVSIGSGFRGGLFSTSLFIGTLFGGAIGGLAALALPSLHLDVLAYTLVGMGAVAAAVVGAPVTMILLVLEMTADFYVAMGVMVAVIFAVTVVRFTFGYSFATWRFHIRGVPIRGAADIGWMHDLTVAKIMRRDVNTVPETMSISEFRRRFALGSVKYVFVLDENGQYSGLVNTSDAYVADLDDDADVKAIRELKQDEEQYLLPSQMVRGALERFVSSELETLPVVASIADRRVIGFVTESYALRMYNQELERARAEELGDSMLFGPR